MIHPSFPFPLLWSSIGPYYFFYNQFLTHFLTILNSFFTLHWRTHLIISLSCLYISGHLLPHDPTILFSFSSWLSSLGSFSTNPMQISCLYIWAFVVLSAENVFPILKASFNSTFIKFNHYFLQEAFPDFSQCGQIPSPAIFSPMILCIKFSWHGAITAIVNINQAFTQCQALSFLALPRLVLTKPWWGRYCYYLHFIVLWGGSISCSGARQYCFRAHDFNWFLHYTLTMLW